MESYPEIIEPMLIEHDGIQAVETRAILATEPRRPPDSGAHLLMRAVLRDAILCLQGQAPDVSRQYRARVADEARHWILSRDLRHIFSFEAICDVLGLDAANLRSHLLGQLPVSEPGAAESEAGGQRRRDLLRQLRRARMRGNRSTQVVQPRRRAARPRRGFSSPQAGQSAAVR